MLGLILARGLVFCLRPEVGFSLPSRQAAGLLLGLSLVAGLIAGGAFALAHISTGCDKLLDTHRAGLKIAELNPLEVVVNHAILLHADDMGGMANAYRLATLIRARSGEE